MKKERVFVYIILLVISMHALSQTADFTADTLEGCETLTVKFTDLSIGTIDNWHWDFGDGVELDTQNPTHTYSSPGIYTVSLILNDNNIISEVKQAYIKVYPPPESGFLYSDTLKSGDRNITFHGFLQNDGQYNYEQFASYNHDWSFGDGNSGTGRVVLHQFPDTGWYTVQHTVTIDSIGSCASNTSIRVYVRNKIYLPNFFSPDNDGTNDLFIIRYNGANVLNIQIFSRYGIPVYNNSARVISWNGRTNAGAVLNAGVYYYLLTSDDGEINEQGFLHLFK